MPGTRNPKASKLVTEATRIAFGPASPALGLSLESCAKDSKGVERDNPSSELAVTNICAGGGVR